jgi:photosystem II stability/assembly factor-like uncharacterized protein
MKRRIAYWQVGVVAGALAFTQVEGQTLGQASGPWVMEKSGTTAGLRGIHAVGGGVAWASGTDGTVLRTEDGGYEWQSCAMPPGAEKLDFRGVWAWDADTAIVMSSGPGEASRLYKTTDGCSSWKLVFTNPDKDGFWDAAAFRDQQTGSVLGDPVQSAFVVLDSTDGGSHWVRDRNAGLHSDGKHQGAFAASNSALTFLPSTQRIHVFSRHWEFFGSGGEKGPFIYVRSRDIPDNCQQPSMHCSMNMNSGASSWRRVRIPLTGGSQSSGVFSVATGFSEGSFPHVVVLAVGGDYTKPNESSGTAAWSADGGKTWTAAAKPPHGYRSAVAWDAEAKAWIAAGTNGSDISYDDGKTWEPLDSGEWNALSWPWVVGPKGRIAKLDRGKLPARK